MAAGRLARAYTAIMLTGLVLAVATYAHPEHLIGYDHLRNYLGSWYLGSWEEWGRRMDLHTAAFHK